MLPDSESQCIVHIAALSSNSEYLKAILEMAKDKKKKKGGKKKKVKIQSKEHDPDTFEHNIDAQVGLLMWLLVLD